MRHRHPHGGNPVRRLARAVLAGVVAMGGALAGAAISASPAAAAPATQLVITDVASPTTTGVEHSVRVTATDGNGVTDTSYTGTVTFSCTPACSSVPSNYTFVAGDQGSHLFEAATTTGIEFGAGGIYSVNANDTGTPSIKGSQDDIFVNGAYTFDIAFPSTVPAAAPQNLTVTAKNLNGNTATNYTGTIKVIATDTTAVVPANYTFLPGDNGVKSFPAGVTFNDEGSHKLTVKDVNAPQDTLTHTVNVGVLSSAVEGFQVKVDDKTPSVGAAQDIKVVAIDGDGDRAEGYTGQVTFTKSDPAGVVPANYTFTGADLGRHTFTNGLTLNTEGQQTVTVSDTTDANVSGDLVLNVPDTTGPTGSFTNPAGTGDPAVIEFSEEVKNIAAGDVGIKQGTGLAGADVPIEVVCLHLVSVAPVPCGGEDIGSVELIPADPFVSGQEYTAFVAAGVTDLADNAATPSQSTFQTGLNLQEEDPAVDFLWTTKSNGSATNGSFLVSGDKNAMAAFEFTGTSVTWKSIKDKNQGKAEVFIDGVSKGVFDHSRKTGTSLIDHDFTGLSGGSHVMEIVSVGKGSKGKKKFQVAVDGAEVPAGGPAVADSFFDVFFQIALDGAASGGQHGNATLKGNAVELDFVGTGVQAFLKRGAGQGTVNVSIDGGAPTPVNLSSGSGFTSTSTAFSGLPNALHTIRIELTGGGALGIDRFIVTSP